MWDKLRSFFGAGEASPASANPGYALAQLLRAQEASTGDLDPEIRKRAHRKVEEWTAILQGMLSGDLTIGSRTPVAGTPGWVTLQVISGGFATGTPLAGGPLLPHELELAARLGLPAEEQARGVLNDYFLRGPGHAELRGVKNAAYAWRQMIFFLSLAPRSAVDEFLVWAEEHLAKQSPAFRERFRPALNGLTLAAHGGSLDTPEECSSARRFLGWTVGKHWLFAGES